MPRRVTLQFCLALVLVAAWSASRCGDAWALQQGSLRPESGLSPDATPLGELVLPPSIVVQYTAPEQRLFDDLTDGRLDEHTLLTASLVASGVCEVALLAGYDARLAAFVERRREEGIFALPDKRKAAELLEKMHAELLTADYRRKCTDMAALMSDGHYNCVTATILWQYLAQQHGLKSQAWQLPGHMNAVLELTSGRTEIETTCAEWFSLPESTHHQGPGPLQGHDSLETQGSRALDEAGLLAAIYYNRGIDSIERCNFDEAVAANAKAHRLDPESPLIRRNLLAAINNWALRLASQDEFERAATLLEEARRMAPSHANFEVNYLAIHQQWIDHLIAQGQRASAAAVARRMLLEMPDQPFFLRVSRELERRLAPSGAGI